MTFSVQLSAMCNHLLNFSLSISTLGAYNMYRNIFAMKMPDDHGDLEWNNTENQSHDNLDRHLNHKMNRALQEIRSFDKQLRRFDKSWKISRNGSILIIPYALCCVNHFLLLICEQYSLSLSFFQIEGVSDDTISRTAAFGALIFATTGATASVIYRFCVPSLPRKSFRRQYLMVRLIHNSYLFGLTYGSAFIRHRLGTARFSRYSFGYPCLFLSPRSCGKTDYFHAIISFIASAHP